jgi:hypothetical protein
MIFVNPISAAEQPVEYSAQQGGSKQSSSFASSAASTSTKSVTLQLRRV